MVWERLVGVLAAGLGVLAWVLSLDLPKAQGPGPELFPRILGTALVLGGLYLAWARSEGPPPSQAAGRAGVKAALLLLLFLLAPSLLPHLGVAPTTALMAGTGTLLAGEGLARALAAALALGALAYLVFVRLLGVPA
ncbi:tripartite tricarboxylate transporter TctB family protein [Thermus thermophilus]|uniref:tripartite tricarboxylate transporter TctB family protein n=1 Tax=Thermus thermophilus TaxID=274 RepID=UPI00039A1E12|nr:tripartite tricarboxylate transporter TctB family protein [Thermus thermophilus]